MAAPPLNRLSGCPVVRFYYADRPGFIPFPTWIEKESPHNLRQPCGLSVGVCWSPEVGACDGQRAGRGALVAPAYSIRSPPLEHPRLMCIGERNCLQRRPLRCVLMAIAPDGSSEPMSATPEQLVSSQCLEACCRSDPAAWNRFVQATAPLIHGAVSKTVPPAATIDVDDATQEVFLRLCARNFRLLKSFDPARSSISTFLRVVASSTAIDLVRRRRPPAIDTHELLAADEAPEPLDLSDLPLDVLTDRQLLILRLLFHGQMPVADIARALNVTEQTVRSGKHKALERLRAAVGERPSEPAGDALAEDHV